MLTDDQSKPEQDGSTPEVDPQATMDAALRAFGIEFDPHGFHGSATSGEEKSEGSASKCPYARFFSGIFGDDDAGR